jgi:hypothetical protein
MKLLLWTLLLCNLHCMSVQKKNAPACIMEQIEGLDKGSINFSEVRAAQGVAAEGAETQFSVNETGDFKVKMTFTKETDGDRIAGIFFVFERPTTLPVLTAVFGRFKSAPPTPSGKWSAIARYETGNAGQTYAVIAEAREKIALKTAITKVAIRIDYEE